MTPTCQGRVDELQRRMNEAMIDLAVLSDADSIVYFSDYANYLAMDFGRPTLLAIGREGAPILITPAAEAEMAAEMSGLADIRAWSDGLDDEWRRPLQAVLQSAKARRVGLERDKTHPVIARALDQWTGDRGASLCDLAAIVSDMRMIKTRAELDTMRQAGEVAVAMVEAARDAIGEGVPEYEVALAVINGGTRKAAEFLKEDGPDVFCSPTIYNLQVLQSGRHTCMVHRRSSTKRIRKGDPVYLCFCGIANFRHFKLGFDREFWVGSVTDEEAKAHETVRQAQQAALAEMRPGAVAAELHAAAEEVYRTAGYGPAYRTGRAIGYSFLEKPELKRDDGTRLAAGMTFAVDGGVGVPGRFGARIGDSVAVTEDGYEFLTDYPRELAVL